MSVASCGSTKKATQKKEPTTANKKKGARENNEYNAFFEAEKARIKGDKKKARDLYRDFVKLYKTNATAYYNFI